MNVPTRAMSAIYPLRLRTDPARDVAREYWANQHAEQIKRLPNLVEYNQYHAVERRMGIVFPWTLTATHCAATISTMGGGSACGDKRSS
jgi:hypothetical protein